MHKKQYILLLSKKNGKIERRKIKEMKNYVVHYKELKRKGKSITRKLKCVNRKHTLYHQILSEMGEIRAKMY